MVDAPSNPPAGPSAGPSHQAFPSAPSHGGNNALTIPENEEQLWKLISSCTNFHDIQNRLVPVLHALGKKARSTTPDILAMPSLDLSSAKDDVLSQHTIAFIYMLSARLKRPPKNSDYLKELSVRLIRCADPAQLSLSPPRVTEFAWGLLRLAQRDGETALILNSLFTLLNKTRSGGYFPAVHAVYLEACLISGDLVDTVSTMFPYVNVHEGTSYRDVLTYHYHAGTIQALYEDYASATSLFIFGAAMPANTASAIQLACTKRAILCELLSTGNEVKWPKDMSSVMHRALEKSLERYVKLAGVFAAGDWKAVREQAAAGKQIFEGDCNWGLVERLLSSITKRRILKLRQTYSRLPLSTLASKVEAPEAEVKHWIETMITRREIRAFIISTPEIVTFDEDDDFASPEIMAKLRDAQRMAAWVNKDLVQANRSLSLNRKWLMKQVTSIENKEKGRDALKSRGGDEDEDIGGVPVRGAGANIDDLGF